MTRPRIIGFVLYLLVFWIGILMPFEFRWPGSLADALRHELTNTTTGTLEYLGFVAHVVFFLPLGVLIEMQLERGKRRAAAVTTAAAVFLALLSEFSQLFVARGVSWMDLIADLAGILTGYLLSRRARRSTRLRRVAELCTSPWTALAAVVGVTIVVVASFVPIDTGFSTWDSGYAFLLANEETRDRPWIGDLYDVSLYASAFSDDEASGRTRPRRGPILHYRFDSASLTVSGGSVRLIEESSELGPPVDLHVAEGGGVEAIEGGGIRVSEPSMITGDFLPSRILESIRRARAFTLVVRMREGSARASGPARIVSFSSGTALRNFTLGQEGDALHFRVRNRLSGENGMHPELVADGTVRPGEEQVVVAVSAAGSSRLYVDGELRKSLYFSPFELVGRLVYGGALSIAATAGILFSLCVGLSVCYYLILRRLLGRIEDQRFWPEVIAGIIAAIHAGSLYLVGEWVRTFSYRIG